MYRLDGWKPEAESAKDLSFALVAPHLQKQSGDDAFVIPEFTPISNQGQLGSCVGNSTMDALEILMGIENPNTVVQLSRLHAYWLGRYYTRDTDKDEGTYIRAVFYQVAHHGVIPETLWPYDDTKTIVPGKLPPPVFRSPPLKALLTANSNKITAYYKIFAEGQERLDAVEQAVRANHPVVFGTVVGQQFMSCRDDGTLSRPTDSRGRHAIICTGVRRAVTGRREFYIRNSWGLGWGLNGHTWLDEDYINWKETADLWVPTRMPTLNLYGAAA